MKTSKNYFEELKTSKPASPCFIQHRSNKKEKLNVQEILKPAWIALLKKSRYYCKGKRKVAPILNKPNKKIQKKYLQNHMLKSKKSDNTLCDVLTE